MALPFPRRRPQRQKPYEDHGRNPTGKRTPKYAKLSLSPRLTPARRKDEKRFFSPKGD